MQSEGECAEGCCVAPVETSGSVCIFTSGKCGGNGIGKVGFLQIFQVCLFAGGQIQFAGCPVKFIVCIVVPVRTAANGLIQRCIEIIVLFGSLIGILCCGQTLLGEIRIIRFPKTCCLCCTRCKVQGCACRRRFEDAFFLIVCRCHAESCPLDVVHLVICHALIRAVLHDHLEHPLHLPACLVQQVRIAVLLFRNLHGIVSIAVFCLTGNGTFILVLHHPQSNTAVHHVFSMIAGIVPAAGDIL